MGVTGGSLLGNPPESHQSWEGLHEGPLYGRCGGVSKVTSCRLLFMVL